MPRMVVFIALSLLWGAWVDGNTPDCWNLVDEAIAVVGVMVIMYVPRGDFLSVHL